MATPNVSPAKLRLAAALRSLQQIQEQGKAIVRSAELERRERESLIAAGYIHPIVKGWYFVSRPEADSDETTTWSAAMPEFIIGYCNARFSDMWHLSPAHSILAHVGATALPPQVVVHAPRAGNRILKLPGERSLLLYQSPDFPAISEIEVRAGLRILSIPSALVRIPEPFYQTASTEAHLALAMLPDSSDLNRELVTTGRSVVAGRLIGALRAIGRPELADDIGSTMRAAGYVIQETNPFLVKPPVLLNTRVASPYINRLHIMWRVMREEVLRHFPSDRGLRVDIDAYAHSVKRHYRDDAYHSLSIEGYRVTDALIERVATGVWSPAQHATDADAKNAMAAHGYWRAFESVLQSLRRVLSGENPGAIGRADHGAWYRELFGPSVDAGTLSPAALAGYRNAPVFITNAEHVPPPREAVREMMPVLFDLISEEASAAVRAVLGHFCFVFVHPYMDGNGRIGRFLMNVMLASGGYPWTIIRVEWRERYITSLDSASARGDIEPFAAFIADAVRAMDSPLAAANPAALASAPPPPQ
jgi:Fic/DOC family